jgi:Recombinase zinc beta ribbon domain
VLPNSRIVPGYTRGEDGVLVLVPELAPVVREVFQRRDRGATIVQLQAFLLEHGIEQSVAGVASMLRSRMYLGEIHFGGLHNPHAHEPIITDRALFERVQRRTVSRGRQAKSQRLLARLGVLRCGTCGSRMVINSYSGNYRCGDTSADRCQRRAAVKAERVEAMVLDALRAYSATADLQALLLLARLRGRARRRGPTHRESRQSCASRATGGCRRTREKSLRAGPYGCWPRNLMSIRRGSQRRLGRPSAVIAGATVTDSTVS